MDNRTVADLSVASDHIAVGSDHQARTTRLSLPASLGPTESSFILEEEIMAHELPPLPYAYAALEPVIDAHTMKLHHDMHHAAYVKNLNAGLDNHPQGQSKSPAHF